MAQFSTVNGVLVEMTPGEIAERAALDATWVVPQAPANRIFKSTIIRRLSDQEAEILFGVLASAPVKSRMLWDASEWIGSDDMLFGTLQAAIGAALGESRASEILAP